MRYVARRSAIATWRSAALLANQRAVFRRLATGDRNSKGAKHRPIGWGGNHEPRTIRSSLYCDHLYVRRCVIIAGCSRYSTTIICTKDEGLVGSGRQADRMTNALSQPESGLVARLEPCLAATAECNQLRHGISGDRRHARVHARGRSCALDHRRSGGLDHGHRAGKWGSADP
jgi:hypothetical protein